MDQGPPPPGPPWGPRDPPGAPWGPPGTHAGSPHPTPSISGSIFNPPLFFSIFERAFPGHFRENLQNSKTQNHKLGISQHRARGHSGAFGLHPPRKVNATRGIFSPNGQTATPIMYRDTPKSARGSIFQHSHPPPPSNINEILLISMKSF